MPTESLIGLAITIGATFLIGMIVGFVLMVASLVVRRQGSVVAARLLTSGPSGGLFAIAIYLLTLEFFPIALRFLLIGLYLATAIPLFVLVLRAKIRFAPIGRGRS